MNTDTTIRSSGLLADKQTDLAAAEEAERIACEAYGGSNSWVDRKAWLEAWNKLESLRKLYQEGEQVMKARAFEQEGH